MNTSPIFLVGAPRSGTSLLRNLLYSHPNLFFRDETHFIPDYYRAFGDPKSPAAARRMANQIVRLEWVRRWQEEIDTGVMARQPTFAAMIDSMFRQMAEREGAQRWGDKTPQNILHISTLLEIFPNAQFVHIVRDGRDAALSLKRTHFGPATWYGSVLYWRHIVQAGLEAAARVPDDQFLTVHYEALLENPQKELERICEFLHEPFDQAVLTPTLMSFRQRQPLFKPIAASHAKQPTIVQKNTQKWRQSLSESEQGLFELLAGEQLEKFGYPRTHYRYQLSALRKGQFVVQELVHRFCTYATVGQKRIWLPTELWLRWVRFLAKIKRNG